MYGFAGTNLIFKEFLKNYTTKADSVSLLDTLVQFSKDNKMQFFMIRYEDNELKLFAYSPYFPEINAPEIFRISKDPAIPDSIFAIGSGKHCRTYKKSKVNLDPQVPIREIIRANTRGLKKNRMLDLINGSVTRKLTLEESRLAYQACNDQGGDIFTGGEIRVTNQISQHQIHDQIRVMDAMDKQAKASNAVCASPINAHLEIKQLERMGQYAVSKFSIDDTQERRDLLNQLQLNISEYI